MYLHKEASFIITMYGEVGVLLHCLPNIEKRLSCLVSFMLWLFKP